MLPEPVFQAMIRGRLTRPDVAAGFVLAGFQGRMGPAASFDSLPAELGTPVDRVIDLVLPDAEVVRRLSGRRTCRGCGRIWRTEFTPPARPAVCDRCGGSCSSGTTTTPSGSSRAWRPTGRRWGSSSATTGHWARWCRSTRPCRRRRRKFL
ncbi:adenylate kinase family protein [Micromonospora sp. DT47]|uniref:adenylate kinase family protein n=1 Tax=Micromonospora sp. DT47 TaxID=3393431 RepID=UPI003CE8A326